MALCPIFIELILFILEALKTHICWLKCFLSTGCNSFFWEDGEAYTNV